MDMNGSYRIPASRETVWAALNDPEVLKECIPGCEKLEMTSPTEMSATVTSKIGPVKAKFNGAVTLENINPPESYTIAGEGKGGVAGFAKGSADVSLAEEGAETVLTYTARAQVGGKLAQLGSRLIDSTARKMADEFFGKFTEKVGGGSDVADDELDAGLMEEAKTKAIEEMPSEAYKAAQDAEHVIEERLHDVEEKVEVAAGRGVFGGPIVWGLIALAAVIVILAVMS
ncbi:carbon monoxide dehydrogenase subunit G [uncultured Roseibium sp.]|uniref:SRPBCC family protein n=1 Tax=uncultured Roseibium sp. TaxID=1936171 RepID=UPI003217AE88